MRKHGIHEDYHRDDEVKGSSDRAFGLVFAVVFALLGLWPLLGGAGPRIWALAVAASFVLPALLRPGLLAPMNRLWLKLGLLLHRIVTPLVMGLIFYTTVTPIGLAMRLAGKDPLGRRFEAGRTSYWIEREPPGPAPETMKRQF